MMLDQFLKLFNFKFKLFRHYLRSGFLIDVMACLPYDILDSFSAYTSSYTDILSILKASISNIIIIIIIIIYNYVYSISTLEPSFDWKLSFPSKSHLIHFFKPSQGTFPQFYRVAHSNFEANRSSVLWQFKSDLLKNKGNIVDSRKILSFRNFFKCFHEILKLKIWLRDFLLICIITLKEAYKC